MFCLEPIAQPQRKPPTETVEIDSKTPGQTTDIDSTKPDTTELLEDEILDDDYEEDLNDVPDDVVHTLFGTTKTTTTRTTNPEVFNEKDEEKNILPTKVTTVSPVEVAKPIDPKPSLPDELSEIEGSFFGDESLFGVTTSKPEVIDDKKNDEEMKVLPADISPASPVEVAKPADPAPFLPDELSEIESTLFGDEKKEDEEMKVLPAKVSPVSPVDVSKPVDTTTFSPDKMTELEGSLFQEDGFIESPEPVKPTDEDKQGLPGVPDAMTKPVDPSKDDTFTTFSTDDVTDLENDLFTDVNVDEEKQKLPETFIEGESELPKDESVVTRFDESEGSGQENVELPESDLKPSEDAPKVIDEKKGMLDQLADTVLGLFGITTTTTKPEVVDEILDDDASADKDSSQELPVTESPIDEDKQSLPVEVPDFDPTAPGEEENQEVPLEIPGFSKDEIKDLEVDLFDGDTKVDDDEKVDAQFPVTDEKTQDMEQQGFDEVVDNRFSDEKESDEQKESEIVGIGGMKGAEESQMVILPQEEFGLDVSKDEIKDLESSLFIDESKVDDKKVPVVSIITESEVTTEETKQQLPELVEEETMQALPETVEEEIKQELPESVEDENKQELPGLVEDENKQELPQETDQDTLLPLPLVIDEIEQEMPEVETTTQMIGIGGMKDLMPEEDKQELPQIVDEDMKQELPQVIIEGETQESPEETATEIVGIGGMKDLMPEEETTQKLPLVIDDEIKQEMPQVIKTDEQKTEVPEIIGIGGMKDLMPEEEVTTTASVELESEVPSVIPPLDNEIFDDDSDYSDETESEGSEIVEPVDVKKVDTEEMPEVETTTQMIGIGGMKDLMPEEDKQELPQIVDEDMKQELPQADDLENVLFPTTVAPVTDDKVSENEISPVDEIQFDDDYSDESTDNEQVEVETEVSDVVKEDDLSSVDGGTETLPQQEVSTDSSVDESEKPEVEQTSDEVSTNPSINEVDEPFEDEQTASTEEETVPVDQGTEEEITVTESVPLSSMSPQETSSSSVIEETSDESEAVIEGSEMTQEEENQVPVTETSSVSVPTEVEEQENVVSEEQTEVQPSEGEQTSVTESTSVEESIVPLPQVVPEVSSEAPVDEITEPTEDDQLAEEASEKPIALPQVVPPPDQILPEESVVDVSSEAPIVDVSSEAPVVPEVSSEASVDEVTEPTEDDQLAEEASEKPIALPQVVPAPDQVSTEESVTEVSSEESAVEVSSVAPVVEVSSEDPAVEVSSEDPAVDVSTEGLDTSIEPTETTEDEKPTQEIVPETSMSPVDTSEESVPSETDEMAVSEEPEMTAEEADKVPVTDAPSVVVPTETEIEEQEEILFQTTTTTEQPFVEEELPIDVTDERPIFVEVTVPVKCVHDGIEYDHLSDVVDQDPCKSCQCDNGRVICATQDCAGPPANYANCIPVTQDGVCCPHYQCDDFDGLRGADEESIVTTTEREANSFGGQNASDVIRGAFTQNDELEVESLETELFKDDFDTTVPVPDVNENIIEDEIFDDDSDYTDETETEGSEIDDDSDDDYEDDSFNSCYENGRVYSNQEDVFHSNPCKKCFCNAGTIICADRVCLVPKGYENCVPLPTTDCCPEQFECCK